MSNVIMVNDVIESNGKTIKENNMAQLHTIEIGSLVEIICEDYPDDEDPVNGLRLYVVNHSRDCDGTPLYDLSFTKDAQKIYDEVEKNKVKLQRDGVYVAFYWQANGAIKRHYSADSLRIIRSPKA